MKIAPNFLPSLSCRWGHKNVVFPPLWVLYNFFNEKVFFFHVLNKIRNIFSSSQCNWCFAFLTIWCKCWVKSYFLKDLEYVLFVWHLAHWEFTNSKATMKTPEQCVKFLERKQSSALKKKLGKYREFKRDYFLHEGYKNHKLNFLEWWPKKVFSSQTYPVLFVFVFFQGPPSL